MKLYSVPLSPFAARVRISIYRKNLSVEITAPPESWAKDDSFLTINPMGQVPILITDSGAALAESAAIVEYLEDVFPTPSLRPENAEDLARARLFLRIPDIYFKGAPRILLGMRKPEDRKEDVIKTSMEDLNKGLPVQSGTK